MRTASFPTLQPKAHTVGRPVQRYLQTIRHRYRLMDMGPEWAIKPARLL